MYFPAGGQTYNLGASIGSTDTSIILSSFTEPVSGVPYTMTLLNTDIVFGTIGPRTSSSEFISFTGITQNADGTATLTGVTRGLAKKYPFTTSVTFQLPHSGQSVFILSDAPQVFVSYAALENDNTLSGDNTFSVHSPTIPTELSSAIHRAASIEYANNLAIAGAPNASTSVKGIVQEATTTQVNSGTGTGSTGAILFASPADLAASIYGLQLPTSGQKSALASTTTPGASNLYVTQSDYQKATIVYGADSVGTDAYAITLSPAISSYTAGMKFLVKLGTANTGAVTLNVNSVGAKAIKKNFNADIVTGDLLSGQVIEVAYDVTNDVWQLLSPVSQGSLGLFKNGVTTYNLTTASGTQTIAHGLGTTPKFVRLTVTNGIGAGTAGDSLIARSVGVYNGTTNSCVYDWLESGGGYATAVSSSVGIHINGSTNGNAYQEAVITFDGTNITFTWTKTNSPTGSAQIMWEVEA